MANIKNEELFKLVNLDNFRSLIDTKKSHEEVAKGIGVSTSTVTRHYDGTRALTLLMVYKYAKYFHTSTDFILGLNGVKDFNDTDLARVSDLTGLSQKAIGYLSRLRLNSYNYGMGDNSASVKLTHSTMTGSMNSMKIQANEPINFINYLFESDDFAEAVELFVSFVDCFFDRKGNKISDLEIHNANEIQDYNQARFFRFEAMECFTKALNNYRAEDYNAFEEHAKYHFSDHGNSSVFPKVPRK